MEGPFFAGYQSLVEFGVVVVNIVVVGVLSAAAVVTYMFETEDSQYYYSFAKFIILSLNIN